MRNERTKGRNWPMNRILGGVFLLAFAVLLAAGLQSGQDEPAAMKAPARAEQIESRLPEPEPAPAPTVTALPEPAAEESAPAPEPHSFADAESSYRDGDFDLAAERFGLYSQAHPDNPWGFYMLGLSEWKRTQLGAAEAALSRSLELDAEFERARLNLSRVLLAADRPEEALTMLRAETALAAGEALRLQGRALHELGRIDEALAAYDAALAEDPGDAWSLNNLGLILIQAERFEEACAALALAVDLDAEQAVFHNNLGIALERSGHVGLAAELYRSVLDHDAAHAKAAVSLERVAALAPTEGGELDLAELAATTATALAAGRAPWAKEDQAALTAVAVDDETAVLTRLP